MMWTYEILLLQCENMARMRLYVKRKVGNQVAKGYSLTQKRGHKGNIFRQVTWQIRSHLAFKQKVA